MKTREILSTSFLKMTFGAVAVGGMALVAPAPAQAYWVRGVWVQPEIVGPPVVYAPAPRVYYEPRPIWIPGHYRGPYWVPGHWR